MKTAMLHFCSTCTKREKLWIYTFNIWIFSQIDNARENIFSLFDKSGKIVTLRASIEDYNNASINERESNLTLNIQTQTKTKIHTGWSHYMLQNKKWKLYEQLYTT